MKRIETEDIVKYQIPQNLQYAPDGKTLVFELLRSDLKKNDYHTDLWMVKDHQVQQLTSTLDAKLLCFQDDSRVLLSRKTEEEHKGMTELFCISVNGGEAVKVMNVPFELTSMKKVNGDVFAAVGRIDAGAADLYLSDEKGREAYFSQQKENEDYQIMGESPFWFNGSHYTNRKRSALFLVNLKEKTVQRVTSPFFDTAFYTVHDEKVYFSGIAWKRVQSLYSNAYCCDLDGNVTALYDLADHSINQIFFLKDHLYVLASDMKEYGVNETAAFFELKGGELHWCLKPEVSLSNSVCGDTMDSSCEGAVYHDRYYTLATVEDHTELFAYDENLNREVLFQEQGSVGCFAVGEKIALLYQDWKAPAEVWMLDGNGPERVTHFNDALMKDCYVAEPKRIDYTSGEDQLHGWVLLPQDFDENRKYPAVLDVHGGPRCAYGNTFFHEMQLWAAKGFIVFFTNIRGSDGRDDAFADIRGKYGEVDFRNLMDFTDAVLKAYPQIDENKVCETGGSYGGFMTNWIITHTDRFCCAASQRSISNWVSKSFISDIGFYFAPDQNGADSPFDFEKLWEHSPLKYAENCKTPTLFIHSEQDHRCPLEQGIQMMTALNIQGIETRMCMFHGENHELSRSGKPLHRIRRLEEITTWFVNHTR